MNTDTYTDLLNRGHALLDQKNLPEKFIKLNNVLQTPYEKTDVSYLFVDINQQIQDYKDQFAVIVQELGVLAPTPLQKNETVSLFFLRLLDLFKMAKTVYSDSSNTRRLTFQVLLDKYVEFLGTGEISFDSDEERSLFDELVQSAWALTKSSTSMNALAKQEGGRLKSKTRKHKRKAQ
jgi:hypothetical protein